MELPQLFFQIFQIRRLISLRAAHIFVSAHVLNDAYIISSCPFGDHAGSDLAGLSHFRMLLKDGPNTWKGTWGPYIITALQRHRHHDIKEEDIGFDKNPSHKEDPDTIYALPSKADLAEVLNKHLDRIYG